MHWWFSRSFKSFSLPYTIINFSFASLKLLTNCELVFLDVPCTIISTWTRISSWAERKPLFSAWGSWVCEGGAIFSQNGLMRYLDLMPHAICEYRRLISKHYIHFTYSSLFVFALLIKSSRNRRHLTLMLRYSTVWYMYSTGKCYNI